MSGHLTFSTGSLIGAAAGFWKAYLVRLDTQAITSAFRLIGSCGNGSGGTGAWDFLLSGANANARFECIDGAGAVKQAPAITFTSADVGKLLLLAGTHTGTALLSFARRVQIAGSTALTGYRLPTGQERIGDPTTPPQGITVMGTMGGLGVLDIAEYQAACDACMAAEDIVAVPGKTDQIVSFKNGQIPASLALTGSLTMSPQYARSWGW